MLQADIGWKLNKMKNPHKRASKDWEKMPCSQELKGIKIFHLSKCSTGTSSTGTSGILT